MKASNKLTELSVRQAKPSNKVRKLSDGRGMYLLVHPNSSKYWRLDFRHDGKQKTMAFGVWPDVSLTKAREIREEAKRKIKHGLNPLEERRTDELKKAANLKEQQQYEENQSNTFRKIAHEWMKRKAPLWSKKHLFDVRRAFEHHIFSGIGGRPIAEISKREILDTLRKLESQNKFEAALRARQRCEAVFQFGIVSGICENNPATGLKDVLTPTTKKSLAALKPEELPEFLKKLFYYEGHRITKLGLRFMLYTFVRTK